MLHFVAVGLLLLGPADESQSARTLDPTNYRSASGTQFLRVDPVERTGRGGARATFLKEGIESWSREMPYALQDAFVGDDGTVCGYAFTEGSRAGSGGELVVAVFSPSGEVVKESRYPRTASPIPHTEDDPRPIGLVGETDADRFYVRVADPDPKRGRETWWRFAISTGERGADFDPGAALGFDPTSAPAPWLAAVRTLPGLPLDLVAFVDQRGGAREAGAIFALFDREGAVAWKLEKPGAYRIPSDATAETLLVARARDGGAVVEIGKDGVFSLWHPSENVRVKYQTSPAPTPAGGATVVELARGSYTPPPLAAEPFELPVIDLVMLEPLALQPDAASRSLFIDLQAWECDPAGNFDAIDRNQRRDFVHRVIDRAGLIASERVLDAIPPTLGRARAWARLANGDWMVSVRGDHETAKLTFLRYSAATGKSAAVSTPADLSNVGVDPTATILAPTADGGFAALLERTFQFTAEVSLGNFAASGEKRFLVAEDFEDPNALFSAKDVAPAPDGTLAVLEHVRRAVKFFTPEGAIARTVSLTGPSGAIALSFPTAIDIGPTGDILVYDYNGTPPLLRFDRDGKLLAQMMPALSDGTMPESLARNARFARDGSVWTTDTRAFYRLAVDGSISATVSAVPEGGTIEKPGQALIDAYGRLLVRDDGNGSVHVFSRDGSKSFVARPAEHDIVSRRPDAVLASDASLGVMVELEDGEGFLRFDDRGRRVGVLEVPVPVIDAREGKNVFALEREGALTLRDETGKVLKSIERFSDGRWIRPLSGAAVAADHTVIVATDHEIGFLARDRANSRLLDLSTTKVRNPLLFPAPDWLVMWSGNDVFLLRSQDDALFEARLKGRTDGSRCAYGVSTDGRHLWAIELPSMRVLRYALP